MKKLNEKKKLDGEMKLENRKLKVVIRCSVFRLQYSNFEFRNPKSQIQNSPYSHPLISLPYTTIVNIVFKIQ